MTQKNVLYLDWPCFGKKDILETFADFGFSVVPFFHENYAERRDAAFSEVLEKALDGRDFSFAFSFNYYPLLSEGCKKHGIPYISIIYDSPYVAVYSYTIINPNNYVFIFDSDLYYRLHNEGISTVYYMPLPVNPKRLARTFANAASKYREKTFDLSFVGSLYYEDHNFFERLTDISDYTRGYLNGIMDAQRKVSGYNFIESVLKRDVLEDMQRAVPYGEDRYGVQPPEYVYATYFIDRKITQTERLDLLSAVSARYPLTLFTLDAKAPIPNARNLGTADYYTEMPFVFKNSKINLNITLRSITSGIPLRCMDIMACGGFLLTNYQADFLRHFVPDEDFVYFEDKPDMLEKIEYFLTHEKERREIAANGCRKVSDGFSYAQAFEEILGLVFHDER